MAYLYRHIRNDTNEVFYIGIGTTANYKRAKTTVSRNSFWKAITCKTDWIWEIILDGIDIEYAAIKEIEFISIYGRRNLNTGTLVNLTSGGDGTKNHIVSEEVKIKLSKINTGKRLSQEHIDKIRKFNIGKKASVEAKDKMRKAKLGLKRSKESIEKTRLKNIGNKSRTGMKTSEEIKLKQKESQILRRLKEKNEKICKKK